MILDIPGMRPAAITTHTEKKLREYFEFRHLFRKRYGFELDWQKLKKFCWKCSDLVQFGKRDRKIFFKDLASLFQREK
jgi:hypothetical protein